MELEPRTTAPAHATGAVAFVPLAAVSDDATFRLREEGDVSALAASVGRLGQLAPVELRLAPPGPGGARRYQVVAGFRRLAALRMLVRERVLARVHEQLDDDDAWGLALGHALLTEPLDGPALERLRARLAGTRAARWADDLLDEALVRAPVSPDVRERFFEFLRGAPAAPAQPADAAEHDAAEAGRAEPEAAAPDALAAAGAPEDDVEVTEVTPEELSEDVARRMWEVNQDLALAAESWRDLPEDGRTAILSQLRWVAAMLAHLEGDEP